MATERHSNQWLAGYDAGYTTAEADIARELDAAEKRSFLLSAVAGPLIGLFGYLQPSDDPFFPKLRWWGALLIGLLVGVFGWIGWRCLHQLAIESVWRKRRSRHPSLDSN
jgi:hypothetical protein